MLPTDRVLAETFDAQAEKFERSPLQSNAGLLAALIEFAAPPPGGLVLDAGCGPGLVAEAFLEAGLRVHGIDLSPALLHDLRDDLEIIDHQIGVFGLLPGRGDAIRRDTRRERELRAGLLDRV